MRERNAQALTYWPEMVGAARNRVITGAVTSAFRFAPGGAHRGAPGHYNTVMDQEDARLHSPSIDRRRPSEPGRNDRNAIHRRSRNRDAQTD